MAVYVERPRRSEPVLTIGASKGEQHLGEGGGALEIAARIVLKVDDELLHALFIQFFDSLIHLLGSVFGKAREAYVANLGVDHIRGVDTVDRNIVADDTEVDCLLAAQNL